MVPFARSASLRSSKKAAKNLGMRSSQLARTLAADLKGFTPSFLWLRIFVTLYVRQGNWGAIMLIRLIEHFHTGRSQRGVRWATTALRRKFGCFVQPGARIGPGLRLPHPNGIVIGSGVEIGARCTIYHQATFGAARVGEGFSDRYPSVGDDVTIFAGAKLIGPIRIGDGAIIGANAVVLRDVPPRHRATGIPAVTTPLPGAVQGS